MQPFPIVGIGASSGGLEAFLQLLQRLPISTGMAFVLVQHLDPRHESQMEEILAHATSMKVLTVTHGMPVKPDHVYVMPPNTMMTLLRENFRLAPRENPAQQRLCIDYFFQSLAQERDSLAVGVILSGNASDGTIGLESIKAQGGITFAQDEHSAKFPEMPRSAILSGVVDFVLRPDKIAEELLKLRDHANRPAPFLKAEEPLDQEVFRKIFRLLYKATKVDFTGYKLTTLQRRIRRRMALNKMSSPKDYLQFLEKNPEEVQGTMQDFLIKVTSFFRDPEVFELLKSRVFPKIVENGRRPM